MPSGITPISITHIHTHTHTHTLTAPIWDCCERKSLQRGMQQHLTCWLSTQLVDQLSALPECQLEVATAPKVELG